MKNLNRLFSFIKASPSPYHAVSAVEEMLTEAGYTRLYENEPWSLENGGKYYLVRNGSSLIAFRNMGGGFMICASHSDSPSFKAKSITDDGVYARLSTERYGGMIMYSWLDRPLSLAGRAVLRTEGGVRERLVDLDADLLTIPSLAIHMNSDVNNGYKFNPSVDMLPITSHGVALSSLLADKLGESEDNIISHDLYLYVREEGRAIGKEGEYILAPRLDDLECVFASTVAFLAAEESAATPVLAIFDNEEVGSETKQGAASDLLISTLARIAGGSEAYRLRLAESFMVSADNAHAKHPAHPELSDKEFAPVMNGGVVIKHSASQSYATDGVSDALFTEICRRAGIKTQHFYNRADLRGGSTLGSISDTVVSLPTVDIGLAQLAMHSAVETAGALDLGYMTDALTAFYSTALCRRGDEIILK